MVKNSEKGEAPRESTHWPRLLRLGREIFWVGVGQFLSISGSMVGVRVLTHLLPPSVYGEMALALTVGTLMQQVFLGPSGNALVRYFSLAKDEGRMDCYLQAGLELFGRASLGVLVVAGLSVFSLWVSGNVDWISTVSVASVFTLLSGYNSMLDGVQNAARQRVVVAWHQGLSQWLRFAAVIPVVLLYKRTALYALCGYCIGITIVGISQTLFLARILPFSSCSLRISSDPIVCEMRRKMWSYAWPFALWGLVGSVQFSADRWALKLEGGLDAVGFYAVLYQIGFSSMVLFSNIIVQLMAPILFQRAGTGGDRARLQRVFELNRNVVSWALTACLLGTAGLYVLHTTIFRVFVAPAYWSVSYLLPWMGLAGGLFACGQIATLSLLSEASSKALLAPKIVCAVLAAGLYFLGAWAFELRGVIAAGVLVSGTYLTWILKLTRNTEKNYAQRTDSGDN